ncbi:MAG TPA: hypothetical protein DCY64_22515 [Hydrogenophaga sp.]|uniref:hypothetical protein n=1 Tax=Hydrogenophaga sp. TaxID=1904254 RepID=UPI0008C1A6BA|nr:hypothetical protein [Hydrogenophaga sp.]OGA78759.1 MAG: hypothetical protein A2X73_07355 [Burkholderiales bacterium GWE1_65_30]OGA89330.1 MAG: hypothetical protein A2X72_16515 [Burkholderiales bacterium GWF1_66_17]HAX23046.1 hypothetical protein [Hydrogenophaga sp.]HBU17090.1 hypothetical protein [Hydrogenophaga sp.]
MTDELQVVRYRSGYRYVLDEQYEQYVASAGIFPVEPGGNEFVQLTIDGRLIMRRWYAWDGASGPAYNDKAFVRPSLTHDGLCQLWQLGIVDDAGRAAADKLLGKMLRHDMQIVAARMPWVTRKAFTALSYVRPLWVVRGVSWYSEHIANKDPGEVLTAP